MTVEEIRGDSENFPAGMRVLAVDDDQVCLMLLDNMLRQCQYNVTTTNQATLALQMLRENKDKFDLVISDVHMPDMDGFKLLELVGLEMDLPVIMLSANSDPKLVLKGVAHGACDYLVKPVRLEELRNIWQHVIRRKKFDTKKQNKSSDRAQGNWASREGHGFPLKGNTEQNGKFNRKRKDEEDESEDNGNESEDPATQKKPRVVWSIELHRKFVGAVNQLGIEKAVPKRILDLMNVDGLTRENVASHLQKYRLYLKRISSVATQQANLAGASGSPFMHMGSLDGLTDFRASLSNVGLSPYATSGMLGRLNSPANVNLHNLTPSALVQLNQAQNLSNSLGQNSSLFQGISPSLEPNLLIQNAGAVTNFNTIDNPRMFTTVSTFADPGAAIGSSSNLLSSTVNSTMMPHGNGTHGMAPYNSDSFSAGVSSSSNLLDPEKCNENWQNTADPSKMQLNPLPSTESFQNQFALNGSRDNNSSNGPFLQNTPVHLSSGMAVTFEDSREMQYHEGLVGDAQNMNQRWADQTQNYALSSNNAFGSLNSNIAANSGILNHNAEMFVNGRWAGSGSTLMQPNESGAMATESRVRSNEEFLLEQSKLQGGFVPQGYDALDELVNAMIKPGEERLSQLETLKSRLAQIGKDCISYPEFLEICSKYSSSFDQGLEFAKILEQSGSVIVVGGMVFLRLQQVHNQGPLSS